MAHSLDCPLLSQKLLISQEPRAPRGRSLRALPALRHLTQSGGLMQEVYPRKHFTRLRRNKAGAGGQNTAVKVPSRKERIPG